MARKSRIVLSETAAPAKHRIFRVGLYVRLSVLNGGNKDNDMAETQESILRAFVGENPCLTVTAVYVDNGETGTDFKRSEFEHLIEDVKKGMIDCIVVKDLSRFGRNYIETGEYLEKIFPFLGVRFIAVNDHYDSIDPSASDILTMHLKNLVNDIYARDLSQKICPVLRGKQERGEYIGNWAPYGYLKSPENKNRLIVDPKTAPVVRDMFQWRLEGYGYTEIARKLIEAGIASPGKYRWENGLCRDKRQNDMKWSDQAIKSILSSQIYIGHMVQGKCQRTLWKGQKHTTVPKEQWIVVENTHEAIVDSETFHKVQTINQMVKEQYYTKRKIPVPETGKENILQGKAICGNCGTNLRHFKQFSERKYKEPHFSVWFTYCCRNHLKDKNCCPFTSVREKALLKVVFEAVKIQMMIAENIQTQMKGDFYQQRAERKRQELKEKAGQVEKQLLQISRHKESLYDDYAERLMSEQDYVYAQKRYQNKEAVLRCQLQELEIQASSVPEAAEYKNRGLDEFFRFRNQSCLTREMVSSLIDRVIVFDREHITIQFRYEDEFQKLQERLASIMEVGVDAE